MNPMTRFIMVMLFLPSLSFASTQKLLDAKTLAPYEKKLKGLEDKERIIQIRRITSQTKQNKPDIALHYLNLGLQLLQDMPNDKLKSELYHNAAWIYITKSDYEKARKYAKEGLELAKQTDNLIAQGSNSTALGAIALYQGDTVLALNYYKESLTYAQAGNHKENIATNIANTGGIYYTLGDLDTALQYMSESRELHAELKNWASVATIEMNIAEIYVESNNIEKALPYYLSALETHEKANNTWYIAKVKSMLGVAYSKNGMLEKAQKYTNESIALFSELGEKLHLTDVLQANGIIYRKKGLVDKAIGEFNKALNIAQEKKGDLAVLAITMHLADIHIEIEKYDEALTYALIALEKTQITKRKTDARTTHKIISRIYEGKNNLNLAYKHLKIFDTLNTEVIEKEISEENERAENLYQSVKKEKKIGQLTAENQLKSLEIESQIYKRNTWVSGLALLIFIAFFIVYRQMQKKKLISERAQMMAELVDKKNQLLADVSHELRTPLTVLQLKIEALQHNLVKDVDASYDSLMVKIGDINKLITDIYQLAQSDIGALELDIQINEYTTTIMQWADELAETVQASGLDWQQDIRLPESLNINFDNDKLKQVISNLVANSIAYTDTPGKVILSSAVSNNYLEIVVEDSSPGVSNENLPRIFERLFRVESSRSRKTGGSGLGLSICKNIIEAHQGTISSSDSQHGGLKISITLPLMAA